MPKREEFESHIVCKECDVSGVARYTENENPVYAGSLNTRLESVTPGFAIKDLEIFCEKCDVRVKSSA